VHYSERRYRYCKKWKSYSSSKAKTGGPEILIYYTRWDKGISDYYYETPQRKSNGLYYVTLPMAVAFNLEDGYEIAANANVKVTGNVKRAITEVQHLTIRNRSDYAN
jgi:hypothetical protein